MDNKSKKTVIIVFIIIIILVIAFYVLIKAINKNKSINTSNNSVESIEALENKNDLTIDELISNDTTAESSEDEEDEEDDKSLLGKVEILTSRDEYISAKQCVTDFNYITSMLLYKMNNQLEPGDNQDYGQLLINILDKSQVDFLNISKDNLYAYAGMYTFVAQTGYKLTGDFDSNTIILYGYRINLSNNTTEDYGYAVRYDTSSKIYSIFTYDYLIKKGFNMIVSGQKIELYDSELNNNGNNNFRFINCNSFDIAQDYLNMFKLNAIYKPELAYKELNSDYATKFGSVEGFQNYINNNKDKFNSIVLGGCNKLTNDGNDKYVCQDNNKNTFTIIAKPDSDIFDFKIEFSNIVL